MLSSSIWAILTLAVSTAMAIPEPHGSYYGRHRYHGSRKHRHHTNNGTVSASTLWVTVTVDAGNAVASSTLLPVTSTADAVLSHTGCNKNITKTITSVTTIFVTPTTEATISTTTSEIDSTTTVTSTLTSTITVWPTSTEAITTTDVTATTDTATADAVTQTTTEATTYSAGAAAGQFFNQPTTLATVVQSSVVAEASTAAVASSAGSKKGLSFNNADSLKLFGNSGASWAYNWDCKARGSVPDGIEYVPMYWGKTSDCKDVDGTPSTILSFNEPDHAGQANIDPQTAYTQHVANVVGTWSGRAKIGSPAVTNSGEAGEGLEWMRSFLQLCKPDPNGADACKLDFLAIHWYASPSSLDGFKSHVTSAIQLADQYNIPGGIWITEFATVGGTMDEQVQFLTQSTKWLESSDAARVEKYAYFMADKGPDNFGMVLGDAVNALGQVYDTVF